MGDDIGSGLLSMAVCFDFRSTNVVQLSNRNPLKPAQLELITNINQKWNHSLLFASYMISD